MKNNISSAQSKGWFPMITILFFLSLILLNSCGLPKPKVNGVQEGEMAPDFTEILLDGSTFSLSDLRGDYVLLDFWGSWCRPCRKANPGLVRIHQEFHDKEFVDAGGFHIVNVAIESDSSNWKPAIEKDGLIWKHHVLTLRSNPNRISKTYGMGTIPMSYLIDPTGKIIGAKWSEKEIKKYLKGKMK